MAKKKKTRVELRKNRSKPPRVRGWTRGFEDEHSDLELKPTQERIRAKGELSRKRTIIQDESKHEMPVADPALCLSGRVVRVHGLYSIVQTPDGREFRCAVRRMVINLVSDARNAVVTGDQVWICPGGKDEGVIERVEPRHGCLTRASRKRQHVLVANVDQLVIVMSLVEPALKPHLVDRYLASAEQGGISAILCFNKSDLIDPAEYQSLVGFYSQLGIPTMLTSAVTGVGIERLRKHLKDRETVFSGQSGVGKSSLLNAIQPELGLHVREVSEVTEKGKHTTTTASLLPLESGGWVVDTPGIRQFELWDIIPQEVEGFFPEFHPYVHLCDYPDCTHTHEEKCAIKNAVALHYIRESRYFSYLGMYQGKLEV